MHLKQIPTDRSADRSTGPISLFIEAADSVVIRLGSRSSHMKQLPTDRSADRSTGPISLINYLISEVINFGRM